MSEKIITQQLKEENELVNNIKDNTVSEIDAKKRLNTLNIIKNSETKHKRLILGQKELLNLFDDLSHIILSDKTLESQSQEDENKNENEKVENENEKLKENKNENKNENENENENENVNENDKTLMSSRDDDDIIEILTLSNEYAETKNQNEKNIIIKKLNDYLDEIIDKSKSFENQIKSIKKVQNLDD